MKIPNHYSARLSELDMKMAIAVPPGGNWKDIPETIPSRRLQGIRESYAAGKGSRSTYYGRLHPRAPSYTINTYFNRPGNGCHLHYDYEGGQHRVLSQREAARLQSFPDSFEFYGGLSAINKQIGNAVPPLLAYQIAKCFPYRGQFVDLFSGAGGLSLGFKWAGWEPIVANDWEQSFLETYSSGVHAETILGDIRDREVFDVVVERVRRARREKTQLPLMVLGGPPCQGFSTAGNRRSVNDKRNLLFRQFKAMLVALEPTWFVFENVPGLLNMEGGRVFEMIRGELQTTTDSLATWKLHTEQHGIPQRRTRIFLVGNSLPNSTPHPPEPVTRFGPQQALFHHLAPAITVEDALSDLPILQPSEDGSHKDYRCNPMHPYQSFMRSYISAERYLQAIRKRQES